MVRKTTKTMKSMEMGKPHPPGQGQSKKAKKRRKMREMGSGMARSMGRSMPARKRWYAGFGGNLGPLTLPNFNVGSGTPGSRMARLDRQIMDSREQAIAAPALDPQVRTPFWRRGVDSSGRATDILCGTEYISTVTTGSEGSEKGDILFSQLLNPSAIVLSRIKQFAALYQRYRFKKLNIYYGAIANETISGQVLGFCSYDVDNLLTNNEGANMNIGSAQVGKQFNQISQHQVYPFGIRDAFTTLFTSLTEAEERLVYQGVFYLLSASTIAPTVELGNIFIEYECEFSINQLAINVTEDLVANLGLIFDDNSLGIDNPMGTVAPGPIGGPYQNNVPYTYDGAGNLTMQLTDGNYLIVTQSNGFFTTQAAAGATCILTPHVTADSGPGWVINHYPSIPSVQFNTGSTNVGGNFPTDVTNNAVLTVTGTDPSGVTSVNWTTVYDFDGANTTYNLASSNYKFYFSLVGMGLTQPPMARRQSDRAPKLVSQSKHFKELDGDIRLLRAEMVRELSEVKRLRHSIHHGKMSKNVELRGLCKVPESDSDSDDEKEISLVSTPMRHHSFHVNAPKDRRVTALQTQPVSGGSRS